MNNKLAHLRVVVTQTRPTTFIGSSVEGLPIAEALQQNLDRAAQCVLWSQGVFGLMSGTLEALVTQLQTFDFAVLVLTPDDMVTARDDTKPVARDNVLFEFGLFIGALGRERTFGIYERNSGIKLPSDLAGVTLADFETPNNGNLRAALGAASTELKQVITNLGVRPKLDTSYLMTPDERFRMITALLEINDYQLLILLKESDSGFDRDVGTDYRYSTSEGPSGNGQGSHYAGLCGKLADADILQINLRNKITLSNRGREYVTWLIDNGYKCEFFESNIGGWDSRTSTKS